MPPHRRARTQASEKANDAAPDAPRIDPSQSPIADPASPLYGWEKFSSAEGKFSAIFPTPPKEDDKTVDGKNRSAAAYSAESDLAAMGQAITMFREWMIPRWSWRGWKRAWSKSTKGKSRRTNRSRWTAIPAPNLEFVYGDKPDYAGSVKLISVGRRIYIIIAIFHPSHANADEREPFFNSFVMQ